LIHHFCNRTEHSWYVSIDPEWAGDWFNQHGISSLFDDFDAAVELITDRHGEAWASLADRRVYEIHYQAVRIYGMLHARWICQPRGMAQMKLKVDDGVFGQCPRFACHGTNALPMGETLTVRRHTAKLFCPRCRDIYRTPSGVPVDGAHFGPAFPHMFLCEFTMFDKSAEFAPFEVRAFGFKVHRPPAARVPAHATNRHDEEVPLPRASGV